MNPFLPFIDKILRLFISFCFALKRHFIKLTKIPLWAHCFDLLFSCPTTNFGSFRSSRRRCSVRKGVLRNFAKFTGKHLKKRCFAVHFAKFLRIPFLENTSGRLLLVIMEGATSLTRCWSLRYSSFGPKVTGSLIGRLLYFARYVLAKSISDHIDYHTSKTFFHLIGL